MAMSAPLTCSSGAAETGAEDCSSVVIHQLTAQAAHSLRRSNDIGDPHAIFIGNDHHFAQAIK